jgi:UPF0042 nucleotide-binding protein
MNAPASEPTLERSPDRPGTPLASVPPAPVAPAAGEHAALTIVSGLSGAGRGTAARCLEDVGWFVVDNLPPALLPTLADLGGRGGEATGRIAVVIDVRGGEFFDDLQAALTTLRERGQPPRILFLEADDDTLVRRFENVRRPHPLQGDGRLVDGITRERELLRDLKAEADLVIDTSELNIHELRRKIDAAFADASVSTTRVTVVSFGFKYGLPLDADMVLDCRWLPNPHWVPDLRAQTGRDAAVRDYVLGQPGADRFVEGYADVVRTVVEGYGREGRRFLNVAVGCTGGKHRSVAVSERLAALLREVPSDGEGPGATTSVRVIHRDLGRE